LYRGRNIGWEIPGTDITTSTGCLDNPVLNDTGFSCLTLYNGYLLSNYIFHKLPKLTKSIFKVNNTLNINNLQCKNNT